MSSSGFGGDGLSLCSEISVTKLPLGSGGPGLKHGSQTLQVAAVLSPPLVSFPEFQLPPGFGTQ